nr:T9SS type A sorting domain-containing protein [uncultured Fluviicola sp.]
MNRLIATIFFSTILSSLSFAQPGSNDFSFNPNDTGINRGSLVSGIVYTSCVQPDGKIVIGGNFTAVNGVPRTNIARLNPNGTLDSSFNTNYSAVGTSNYTARASVIQPDGKIIMAINENASSDSQIIRINPDGTLESVMNNTDGDILTISLQPDGKIIVGGEFMEVNIDVRKKIARLNSNGSIDQSFYAGNGVFGTVYTTAVQPDGKILIGGNFSTVNYTSVNDIARLNGDGSVDLSFNPGSGVDYFVQSMNLQADGKILIGGNFTDLDGFAINRIARLNTDGTRDNNFDPGTGINQNDVWTIQCQSDGKILAGGYFNTVNDSIHNGIVRFETDGIIDSTFNVSLPANTFIYAVNIIPGGKIVLGGSFSTVNDVPFNKIVKVNEDGSLDDVFNSGTGATNVVHTINLQTDGKLVVGGIFYSINNAYRTSIARLNPQDGNLDSTFEIGTGAFLNVSASYIQADGKILLGGNFTSFNDTLINRVIRLNSDGSIDQSFDAGTGADGAVTTIKVQSDGKILLGGEFFSINNVQRPGIARLNPDGSLDMSFNIGSGFNDYLDKIILQPDGKILAVGNFTSYNGASYNKIVRLNEDGTPDASFNSGSGPNTTLYTAALQPNGKILLGGSFTSFNGNSGRAIVRLNADGTMDPGFNILTFTGSMNTVNALLIQPNGRIVIGGLFSNINGVARKNIARLNADGTLDTTFNPGSGTNTTVTNLAVQSDGRIIMSGNFTTYNGINRNRIARLLDCYPSSELLPVTSCNDYYWAQTGVTYTTSGQYSDTLVSVGGCDSIITLDLAVYSNQPITISAFASPSDANSCIGQLAVTVSENAPFELDLDNGSQMLTSNGYSLIMNLCPGMHDLHVTDYCGDTLSTTLVIPVDSNYVFNNPFVDSLAQDSLGVTMTNCNIYYAGIDTAYIDSIWANGNTVNVIWNIVDSNGSNFDTTSYVLNNGNGVYWVQLSVFCPNKSLGEYFTVTEAIYFNNGHVSTAGLTDLGKDLFEIYPNPTNDQIHISFSGSAAELIVYDLQGKVVLKDRIQNNGTVSLQNFERGVYLFDFKNSQGHSIQRVVKQ